jgi:acyl-CoA hydrolase
LVKDHRFLEHVGLVEVKGGHTMLTEQGIADCFGHSEKQQAHNLIENAAHPDARAELRVAASKLGLV